MKALAGWIYVLVDSIFRIETVLEWVFQQVIHSRSYVLLSKHVDDKEKMGKWVKKEFRRGLKRSKGVERGLKDSNSGQNGSKGVTRGLKGSNSGQKSSNRGQKESNVLK